MKLIQRTLGLLCLSFFAVTGGAFAQATTNQLGIPAGPNDPGSQSNPTTQGVPAPTSRNGRPRYPLPDTLSSQAHPAPTPTPKPNSLSFAGKIRGYSFDRLNDQQKGTNIDKRAYAFGVLPHLDYRIGNTPLNIGYTYGGSTGFGFNGPNPILNAKVDNTLPGYPLSQDAHELYLQYKDAHDMFTVGNMELNYPWLALEDTRILPASYQGVDSQVALGSTLSAGITRVIRFEPRNYYGFYQNTLLTYGYPGDSFLHYHPFNPGTLRVSGNYHPAGNVVISAENDDFYNIANLTYLEGKVGLDTYSRINPYIAAQFVSEGNDAKRYAGIVNNRTIGAQLGFSPEKNLLFSASGDFAPWHYAYVDATSAAKAEVGYFVGSGGTGDATKVGDDLYRVAYGGIASPYTDSTNSDPIYTAQISQGVVERRSAGQSYKAALILTNNTKQLRLLASEGWYDYSNLAARNLTEEFNVDGTYFFSPVRRTPYKGFFVRIRIAPRQQFATATTPQVFEYQRFQTEYDF